MVKTPGSGRADAGTRFGTLGMVIDELKKTNDLLIKQGAAQLKLAKEQSRDDALASKKNLEKSREKGGGSKILGAGRLGVKGLGAATGLTAAGSALSFALAPLTSGLGFILKPIKLLAKLVLKGGPLALVVGGLFALFKDITDNPTFSKTVESIKTTWNDSIVPLFDSIKESVNAIMNNEGVQTTFTTIGEWFTNFKIQIQDWVLGNLKIITDTIAGVLEGVDLLLKGDWKEGLSTIGTTLFNGIKNVFDNTITNILELFGVDFGEGGTFLSSVGDIIDSLTVNMINKWREFKEGVKDTWKGLINFFVGEDGTVMTTIKNIKESMSNAWNNFTTGVSNTWDSLTTGVKNKVSQLLEPLTVTLPNKIGEIKDGLIDSWNNIKSKIMEALTNVSLWFMFKPKELGLMLEEKWIETKGKFMEKLASFAGFLASIPSRLKLSALQTIDSIPGAGFLVSDGMIQKAQAGVDSGADFAASLLTSTQTKTQEDLARIARERAQLEARKSEMEKAAQVIIQQNSGGTSIQTTNLSQSGGAVGDPYANSYMGQQMPSFI